MFFIILLFAFIYFFYYFKNREFFKLASQLPGPKGIPFFGVGLEVLKLKPKDEIPYYLELSKKYGHVVRVMLGSICNVILTDPEDIKIILSSQNILQKTDQYKFFDEWLRTGLITSSDAKWHSRRKIITPAFHFKILEQFVLIFEKHSSILVEKIRFLNENHVFDICEPVTMCILDNLCETAMGVKLNSQHNSDVPYIKAIKELTSLIVHRIRNPFMYINFFYKFSNTKKRFDKLVKIVHAFTKNVILRRREELMNSTEETVDLDVGAKKKIAFLDILLRSTIDGKPLSNEDIQEEVDTFMFAGLDTTSNALIFCFYNLAKYSEIQDKVFEDIRNVMGDEPNKTATLSDLNKMSYLEMFIKETLRLYPPVGYGRKLEENLDLNGKIIPRGANVLISIFSMGRNENLWEDPLKFKPERFAVDAPRKHPFLFIPFSAGPRNCIGQKFAMLEIKSTISKILRNFELTLAPGYELILRFETIFHSESGLKLLVNKRKYEKNVMK